MTLKRLLAGAAGALSLAAAAPAAQAEPALWAVKSPTTTVYLFGTVHLLRPQLDWESPCIKAAFEKSQELWLEIKEAGAAAQPQPSPEMAQLFAKYGLDPAHPLSTKLNDADKARLQEAAKSLGADPAQLEPLRPWLVALQLSIAPLLKAGYDPAAGVDRLLGQQATARGEPIKAFETVEEQLKYFADLPQEEEVAWLRHTLKDYAEAATKLEAVAKAWDAGDVDAIARELDDSIKKDDPKLYDILLTKRNERFAAKIAERLKTPGVAFVAVGAGHLAGPDSVQAQLAKLGIKAVRECRK